MTRVCALAGVNLMGMMQEPTLVAAAYCMRLEHEHEPHHVLVYDLGGGALDVCIVCVHEKRFTMLGGKSAMQLGGADFDNVLFSHVSGLIA